MILNKLKIALFILIVLSTFSCSKENTDNHINETIFVRHKQADMPAYIHGNVSEKVFLIILHGGPGGVGLWYRTNTIKSEIENNNVVVYFDQRGSGNSQGNYSKEDVSVDLMAEDVVALVKILKAKYGADSQFFLMGHSWGGCLGSAVLLKNQEYFSGWIEVDGSHNSKNIYYQNKITYTQTANEQIALGNSIDYWESILDLVQNVDSNYNYEDFVKMNVESGKAHEKLISDLKLNKDKLDGLNNLDYNFFTFAVNQSRIVSILEKKGLFESTSFTDRLHEITIPSLVLWGKYDLNVPVIYAYEAYENLGSSDKELFIFDKSTHSPMYSEPDLFAYKVIEFINSHK